MTGPGTDLLKLLGSGSRPGLAPAPSAAAAAPGVDFGSLLKQAREGTLASGRSVTVAKGAGVNLSAEQLARLSAAADKAEAQGATGALVLIDGMALKLNLTTREVTGRADLNSGAVLTGVDSVVSLPSTAGSSGAAAGAAPVPLPKAGAGWGNASLLQTLSQTQPQAG